MNAKLWINTDQQMHLVRKHFQTFKDGIMLRADLMDNLLQTHIHALYQHLAPILGTPHHMVVAHIGDIAVRS
jgi:hypothetical protein